MAEHDEDRPEAPASTPETRRPRPSQPMIRPAAPTSGRPSQPVMRVDPDVSTGVLPHADPAPEAAMVDYSRKPIRPPANLAKLRLRQTLIPPTLVLGIGFIAFGGIYFTQPAGSALRHLDVAYAIAAVAFGAACLVVTILTMFSVRKEMQASSSAATA